MYPSSSDKTSKQSIRCIRRLEAGEFEKAVLEEQMIEYYQVEKPKPEVVVLDEDDGDHD
jgi:hypothetical protein